MDSFGFKLFFALACVFAVRAQDGDLTVTIETDGQPLERKEGQSVTMTCVVNRGLEFIVTGKVSWFRIPYGSEPDAEGIHLTEQGTLQSGANPDDEIVFDFKSRPGNILSTLTLNQLAAVHDGKYVCRAIENGVVQGSADGDLTIFSNVARVELVFDGEAPVMTVEPNNVQRKEGEYTASCTAKGFNPSATVAIFLGEERLDTTDITPTLDQDASQDAGARRYMAQVALTNPLRLSEDHTGKSLRCRAAADFQGAAPRTASFPVEIIAMKPTIVCDKNISQVVGDLYVKIRCDVDYASIGSVAKYEYEIGETGERIGTNMTATYDQVTVERINATADTVILELYELMSKHVDLDGGATYFYLDVTSPSGKSFREKAVLYVRSVSGASKPAAFILAILLSLLLSLW